MQACSDYVGPKATNRSRESPGEKTGEVPRREGTPMDGSPSYELAGQGALVTGGTTGIGRASAERLVRAGMSVVITGRDLEIGERSQDELRSIGEAWFIPADSSDEAAVHRSVAEAHEQMGRIDVLVNNAGIGLIASLIDTPLSDFDRLMAVNVGGPLLYTQAARPYLVERRGSVINIASDAGLRGAQMIGAYSVSKAALIMMSRMLALDLAPEVRCNCVCPGTILPGMRHFGPSLDADAGEDTSVWGPAPLGRIGEVTDVAEAVLFFASRRSAFCSGATLLVDGGSGAGVAATPYP
jgi:NAD(P)-dependent dehydrogenase (short-subunit alcohol dehydrogenase family)